MSHAWQMIEKKRIGEIRIAGIANAAYHATGIRGLPITPDKVLA